MTLNTMTQPVGIRGFFRVQIVDDPYGAPRIVGDSGWRQNQVTNDGFNDYLCRLLGNTTSSKQVTHMALGTGTAPGTADTSLQGELDSTSSRAAVTVATSSTSKTVRFTATFSSASSFASVTVTLRNIGLFNTSTVTTGTIFAGNTYATSQCQTNQNVNYWRHLLVTIGSKLRKFGEHLSETIPSQQRALACGRV